MVPLIAAKFGSVACQWIAGVSGFSFFNGGITSGFADERGHRIY
jgi:site-specific recombinase